MFRKKAVAMKRMSRVSAKSTTAHENAQLRLGLELRRKVRERHVVHRIVACGCQKAVQIERVGPSTSLRRETLVG